MQAVADASIRADRPDAACPSWNPLGALRELAKWLVWTATGRRRSVPSAGQVIRCDGAGTRKVAAAMLERTSVASVIVVVLDDLRQAREVFGRAVAREVVRATLVRLRLLAGRHGVIVRNAPALFTVLVPDVAEQRTLEAAVAVLGKGRCIEVDYAGEEILMPARFMVRTLTEAEDFESLHREMCAALSLPLVRREQRRHVPAASATPAAAARALRSAPVLRDNLRSAPVLCDNLHHQPIPPTIPMRLH